MIKILKTCKWVNDVQGRPINTYVEGKSYDDIAPTTAKSMIDAGYATDEAKTPIIEDPEEPQEIEAPEVVEATEDAPKSQDEIIDAFVRADDKNGLDEYADDLGVKLDRRQKTAKMAATLKDELARD